ncbi:MAG: universal stress protein [Nocardioidaceae bacterium]
MRRAPGRPVVVGVNGTSESQLALRWAVEEAKLRRRPLHVVSAYHLADAGAMAPPPTAPVLRSPPREIRDAHGRALEYAQGRLDVDEVSGELVPGGAVSVLRRAAKLAELLVIGARGRTTRHSVSHSVAAHASCPTVVVRDRDSAPTSTIVVGLDGSGEAERAAAFAFEEAELREATVEAVHYWVPVGPDPGYKAWVERTGLDLRRQVAESVAALRTKYPAVVVNELVLEGRPIEELVDRSANADLVVVGSRGLGRLVGALLGSVSHGLLSRAHCSVLVVKGQV